MNIKITLFCLLFSQFLISQDSVYILNQVQFNSNGVLYLPNMDEWIFQKGDNEAWANSNLNVSEWKKLTQDEISSIKLDEENSFEGWFRIKVKLDSSLAGRPLFIFSFNTAASDVYFNGQLIKSFGNTGLSGNYEKNILQEQLPEPISLEIDKEYLIAVHFKEKINSITALFDQYNMLAINSFLVLLNNSNVGLRVNQYLRFRTFGSIQITIVILVLFFFWLLVFLLKENKHLILIAISITSLLITLASPQLGNSISDLNPWNGFFTIIIDKFTAMLTIGILPLITVQSLKNDIPKWLIIFICISIGVVPISLYLNTPIFFGIVGLLSIGISLYYIISFRKKLKSSQWALAIGICVMVILFLIFIFQVSIGVAQTGFGLLQMLVNVFPLMLLVYVAFWLKETIANEKLQARQLIEINEEKKAILEKQNLELETKVEDRTRELSTSLKELKSTQSQLIQAEKMASLGELTAGIAHEIQNPLNFVNNFSEINAELTDELLIEVNAGNLEEIAAIANDIAANEKKIIHHGQRADGIVKGMLLHSRINSGEKEETDINALADEYLRLVYHGVRAKDNSFNADMITDFDANLPKVKVIPQDIGRVLFNVINNAFQATHEKSKNTENYEPKVSISTSLISSSDEIRIIISDNGSGIPRSIIDKIFQPFFTTKDTGKGTGLGLSLSYDIVKAHGGEMKVETKEGEGSSFIISLPS